MLGQPLTEFYQVYILSQSYSYMGLMYVTISDHYFYQSLCIQGILKLTIDYYHRKLWKWY